MDNWAEKAIVKIESNLQKSKEKDLRFFRVDEFKRNITRIGEFSDSCEVCHNFKTDVAEVVETIYEAVEVPGNTRRGYDRLISRLANHMRREHGFYAPFYFSYVYSFIGIIAALIVGFILYTVFPGKGEIWFSVSFIVGIVTAYISGGLKDSKIRTTKKLM